MNKLFRFKKFTIEQNNSVFKVGTDGVLLGCLANIAEAKTLLDIGTGTGLLSLMSAQKNPLLSITAIDSEKEAFFLAQKNCKCTPFINNVTVLETDLKNFTSGFLFDYIICNPPFFKVSQQLHQQHPIARQQLKLDYELLIKKSKELISINGKIGYIFPFENEGEIKNLARKYRLYPERIIYISGIKDGSIKRIFMEFSQYEKKVLVDSLYIEEAPRVWSDKYKILTKDFYL